MDDRVFSISSNRIPIEQFIDCVFNKSTTIKIELDDDLAMKVEQANGHLKNLLQKEVVIYGVTTGFGANCDQAVDEAGQQSLQENLINYLQAGSGDYLDRKTARAILFARFISLSRGYSGVSLDLLEQMKTFIEHDLIPAIPRQGSLGASGDLIPLSYLGQVLQGKGFLLSEDGELIDCLPVLKSKKITPYRLRPKEGLAIVNGTSAMVGLGLDNYLHASFLLHLCTMFSTWNALLLDARFESFSVLVNEKAKNFSGQRNIAKTMRETLLLHPARYEKYSKMKAKQGKHQDQVQDPYSIRCTPQVLGPVMETLNLLAEWIESEINSVSDNPLIGEQGELATGGNFYGGYMAHGMDYLKISLAHMADLMDRQLLLLVTPSAGSKLSANLVDKEEIAPKDLHTFHGMKALHQNASAITSEIMARTIPNSIFSRSSESHNQDKVSLGMSAANSCHDLIADLYQLCGCFALCLAQATDIKKQELKCTKLQHLYQLIRSESGKVITDRPLDIDLKRITNKLKKAAYLKSNGADTRIENNEDLLGSISKNNH